MGLLDGLLNDPNQMAQLQLGAGLLGGGSFGQALNRGLLGYQDSLNGSQDRALKKTLTQAQLDNYRSEIAQRDVATQKAKALQAFIGNLGGASAAGQASAYGQPGGGQMPGGNITSSGGTAAMPGQGNVSDGGAAPMPNGQEPSVGGNQLLGMDLATITKLKAMGGPDLFDAFKYSNDPLQMQPGSTYRDRVTGAERTIPTLDKGQVYRNGQVANLPGAVSAAAEMTGANARATEGAKAQNDLTQVYDPASGGMVYKSRAQVLGGAQSQAGPNIQNMGQGQLSPALQALIARDAQANGIQNPTANFTGAGSRGRYDLANPQAQPPAAPSGGFAAAQPSSAVLADKAGGNLNDSWIKNSYEPVIASQKTASSTIDTVKISRDALTKMGGSGWGTDAKAQAAGILAGLGFDSGNAKMYASNAQVFNNAAMTRLDTSLKAATGPQTEGDAARASKLYASLGNTTEANKFILDLIEAQANRDQVKARFYQAATPIAREKGDLTEVDRAWEQRAPSVFNMPSMKNWGIK